MGFILFVTVMSAPNSIHLIVVEILHSGSKFNQPIFPPPEQRLAWLKTSYLIHHLPHLSTKQPPALVLDSLSEGRECLSSEDQPLISHIFQRVGVLAQR